MSRLARLRGIGGVAIAQLRHHRLQTVLVVCGVALAVLSVTVLASVGYGVVQTGEEKFDRSGRDLWVTGGPLAFAPGGVDHQIHDAHRTADRLGTHPAVEQAAPIAFQTVYASDRPDPDSFRTLVGVGVNDAGEGTLQVRNGSTFSRGDVHYAGGAYDGPMTYEAVIDARTARLLDVSVGDHIYVGGTVAVARQHRFEVVGISPTFRQFLGATTVAVHTSELQEVTGTTGLDPAGLITVSLAPGADPAAVAADLERAHPELRVRTSREQFGAVLAGQALLVATGLVLVVVAVVAGIALTVNVLVLLVAQQRRELAALRALGCTTPTLVGVAAGQGLLLGVLGGLIGLAATYPVAWVVNRLAATVVGIEGLVRVPPLLAVLGVGTALAIGAIGVAVAGWRVARLDPLASLDSG